ncbi:ElyC/SanA/YdcF family protein [Streptomyces sp. NPDC057582]|uniref:ElyC/SanA/YdcF family protein n=1 Tax=Streptomyces sp. NPDC057582 TaxID=3346174 RepID=UPI0036B2EE0A
MSLAQKLPMRWAGAATAVAALALAITVPLTTTPASASPKQPTVNAACAIVLSPSLPMPKPKADGRGAAMDDMVPGYAASYRDDPTLLPFAVDYQRWLWTDMYAGLDALVKAQPDYLDAYRLQADAYLVNSTYPQALGQLDQVLRRSPDDIQALAVTALIQHFLGAQADADCRMAHLKKQSQAAWTNMNRFIAQTDQDQYAAYGTEPSDKFTPDAIVVFGQSPNADGTPSSGMLTRLEKALEMANRFPDAKIVTSGAAVRTQYAEGDVMADWLIAQGVAPDRIIRDTHARDTVGNSMGMVAALEPLHIHNVLAVATRQHLPRAVTTLKAYAQHVGYRLNLQGVGGGDLPDPSTQVGERQYTYVTAARAAGLFEVDDFAKYQHTK